MNAVEHDHTGLHGRGPHVLILVAAVASFASFLWWQQDDFYIHLQYAVNLSQRGEWSFNAGHPAYGSTSPLWVLLLAAFGVVGADLGLAAKALSVGCAVASVALLLSQQGLFRDRRVAWMCAVSVIANHWYRLSAGTAMEATWPRCWCSRWGWRSCAATH